ncbi:MAG: hypothetical protein Q4D34_06705 [Eggerthellaceae bacterium]|nr:hypothetical protein [Eggerthellaceae bacterium]
MRLQAISPLRVFALLFSFAFICVLSPVFAGQALAETMHCSRCDNDVEPYMSFNVAGSRVYEPTCTEGGVGVLVCPVCGNLLSGLESVPALGHAYSASASTATCTADGEITYTCSRCGDTYSEHSHAVGHDYHRSGTGATCTEDGAYTYTCVRCGDSYTESVPALGHEYVREVTEPTCTEPGAEIDKCSRCGDEKKVELAALGHSWPNEWTVAKKATDTEEGLEYRICQRCGAREERTIPKTGLPIGVIIGGVVILLGIIAFGARKYLVGKAAASGAAALGTASATASSAAGAAGAVAAPSAAAAAVAAAEVASGFELIKLTEKKILAKLRSAESNEEFLQLVRSRPNLSLVLFDSETPISLSGQIEAEDPDAVLLDCAGEAEFSQMMETFAELQAEHKDIRCEAIIFDQDDALSSRLASEKDAGVLFAYTGADKNKYVKMSQLVVPLYKDLMQDADSLESIGIITDLFGIPGVSTMLSAISNADRVHDLGDTVKDAFTGVEMEAEDGVSVVHNIAAILGLDVVAAVSELTEDVFDTRDSVMGDEEGKTHKAYKAGEVGKDIGDVLGSLLG